jgi:hypothetical protein
VGNIVAGRIGNLENFSGDPSCDGEEDNDGSENHEIGVEKQDDSRVIKGPPALEASGSFTHAPGGQGEGKKFPM